jgi:hypothetical protein
VRRGAAVTLGEPAFAAVGAAGLALIFAIMVFASSRAAGGHLAKGIALGAADPSGSVIPPGAAPGPKPIRTPANAVSDVAESQRIVAQLNQYYAANINQGNAIFWASLLSMSIGFAIVFAGIVTAGINSTTTIVAGVAGVLSQFIAATFLVALRSTQQQSTTYAQMLVELRLRDLRTAADARATALGLQLLADIAGDGAQTLANQTRAALAMGLIVQEPAAAAPPAPITVDLGDLPREPIRATPTRAETLKFDTSETSAATQPAPNDR